MAAGTGSAPLVVIEDLVLRFGGITALDHTTAEIPRGQVTAIIGPNGAGKTSLLNALTGVYPHEVRGSIVLDGTEVRGHNPVQMRRLGMVRSFQHPPFLEKETVVDNLLLGSHPEIGYGVLDQVLLPWRTRSKERAGRRRALELLDLVDLQDWADRPVSELPYGGRKVVDVLRATMHTPALLLLDEPTSGLDSAEQETFLRLMQTIARPGGPTVLLVEHHMDVVRRCATHVLGMHMGQVIAAGAPQDVLDSTAFRNAVLGAGATPSEKEVPIHG